MLKKTRRRPVLSLKKAMQKCSSSNTIEPLDTNSSTPKDNSSSPLQNRIIEIIDGLYVSDYSSLKDEHNLTVRKINTIINLTKKNCLNLYPTKYNYKTFNISDKANEEIIEEMLLITNLIHECLEREEVVLVHCFKGISRAPTMVIAYLIRYKGMGFEQAFDFVRKKSTGIDPNAGFLMQLCSLNN